MYKCKIQFDIKVPPQKKQIKKTKQNKQKQPRLTIQMKENVVKSVALHLGYSVSAFNHQYKMCIIMIN